MVSCPKVFTCLVALVIASILALLYYQRSASVVFNIAPPDRRIINRNAEIIHNRTLNDNRNGAGVHKGSDSATTNGNHSSVNQQQRAEQEESSKPVKQTAPPPQRQILKKNRLNATADGLPLLTIFTTLRNSPDRFNIHSNMLKNWAMFQPYIIPVLYTQDTDPKLVSLARTLGWEIIPITSQNQYGTPYFKPMYKIAKERFTSVFYGYSNGDLLFEYGLIDSLKAITGCLTNLKHTLIVGQRYNYQMEDPHNQYGLIDSLKAITGCLSNLKQTLIVGQRYNYQMEDPQNQVIFKPNDVREVSKKAKLFRFDAEDYFFIANNEFPWQRVPDIVVGRPAYDNFMVATAWRNGVSVVDATQTLLALHQSGKDGDYAGHHNSKDVGHNYKVIGTFNYGVGLTKNAQFETRLNRGSQEVEVWHRIQKSDPRSYKVQSKLLDMIVVGDKVSATQPEKHPGDKTNVSPITKTGSQASKTPLDPEPHSKASTETGDQASKSEKVDNLIHSILDKVKEKEPGGKTSENEQKTSNNNVNNDNRNGGTATGDVQSASNNAQSDMKNSIDISNRNHTSRIPGSEDSARNTSSLVDSSNKKKDDIIDKTNENIIDNVIKAVTDNGGTNARSVQLLGSDRGRGVSDVEIKENSNLDVRLKGLLKSVLVQGKTLLKDIT